MTQREAKRDFGHDLDKAYQALDPAEKILNQNEEHALKLANDIYMDKGFELHLIPYGMYDPGLQLTRAELAHLVNTIYKQAK